MLWLGWLLAACLSVVAVDLPGALRVVMCAMLIGLNLPALSRLVLLRGPQAIRWIEWTADGRLWIGQATAFRSVEATLKPASFRLGFAFLLLWFATPRGTRGVLIDACLQSPADFRRLSRYLKLIPSRPKV